MLALARFQHELEDSTMSQPALRGTVALAPANADRHAASEGASGSRKLTYFRRPNFSSAQAAPALIVGGLLPAD